jgi:hypothetical protein
MKTLVFAAIICLGCSKNNNFTPIPSNQDKVIGRSWKTYEFSHNGAVLSAVASQEPNFEFRNDARLYFSQINPAFRDTMQFIFINETNIQLSKPWVNSTDVSNLRIDRITDTDFDFTLTNNKNSDIDAYKTQKQ